jgi:hypothetical protein
VLSDAVVVGAMKQDTDGQVAIDTNAIVNLVGAMWVTWYYGRNTRRISDGKAVKPNA